MDIPNDPTGLSADWLNWALGAGHKQNFPTIKAVHISADQPGKSIVGRVVRLQLRYDQDVTGLPDTLIAKFPTSDPAYLAYFNTMGMYEREVRFYQEIADRVELQVPKCYFASIDIASGKSIILLEDMAPHPNGSRVEGCSQDTAMMVIQQIAELHAACWEDEALQQLTWLRSYDVGLLGERYRRIWISFVQKYQSHLTPETIRLGEQLVQNVEIIRELFLPPLTLVHHDYQLDNMFFSDHPERSLIVIDWQLITLGRGTIDVANFLCWNVPSAMRQRVEKDLLRAYHATLIERGVINYSFEQCFLDYRLAVIECFIRIVAAMGSGSTENEALSKLFSTILARTIAALQELSVADLLQSGKRI